MMTRTDRRRFPVLIAAFATLALAGAVLGLLFSTAEAQEADEVLLSNLGQSYADETNIQPSLEYAQGFTTGSNAGGYVLGSVELDVQTVPNTPADVTVALWSATSGSNPTPDASVATLTHSTGTWAHRSQYLQRPDGHSAGRRHDLLRGRVLQRLSSGTKAERHSIEFR